ncbi:uncharacterized protein [Venturia canescens]|uniref:uncharacterized protein n=1 Tax=Venturia canescens TaxID=32260 RepID=UPI001C9D1545|nr:uncharacterized protein LOC122408969 [Venturia canescens]
MRKTKNGLCLLKLQVEADKPDGREQFGRQIQDVIGEAGNVRAMTSKVQLEIMDLDCVATPDDVTDALRRETGRDADFRVHIFGPNRAEQYMAVCELDSREADALLRRGRIGIGWVHCRVRKRLTVTKCYRCLGFGHVKAECKGKDRTKCCRKCGASGHLATDCKNKPVCPLCSEAGHKDVAHLAGTGRRRTTQTYITNETETTAIWVRGATQSRVSNRGVGDDYVWAKVGAVTYVSVYLTPNCTAAEFERKVALLEDGIRDLPGDVVVAGDLNARAIEWGMTETNRRGRLLLEMAARLDLAVVNTGHTPTYRRPGFGDSIPDVTLTSDELKDAETAGRIVDGLFPTHPIRTNVNVTDDADVPAPPVFVAEELTRATKAMKTGKTPGPDGVPAEILRLVARLRPEILLDLYNTCLTTGTFSGRWKEARLVLIPKGRGDPNTPSAYRPLSLLDTTGKLYEQLLRPRLTDAMQAGGGLSDLQFGFRRGRSTIGAIQKVVDSFLELDRHCHAARPIVLLATLDIRNAFNSARWVDILEALKSNFGIPPYLARVVEDYLKNRRITYETIEGQVTRQVTAGVAQGSILGPDFWNGLYDSLLRLEMPLGVILVAYADDVAAVITERSPELAQLKLNQTMRRVGRWMTDHGLQLATEKTELTLLTRRRIQTILPMRVGAHETETKGEVKYLGDL